MIHPSFVVEVTCTVFEFTVFAGGFLNQEILRFKVEVAAHPELPHIDAREMTLTAPLVYKVFVFPDTALLLLVNITSRVSPIS